MTFKFILSLLALLLVRPILFLAILALVALAFKLAMDIGSIWLLFLPVFILFLVSDYMFARHHLKRPLWSDYWWRFRR